MSIKRDILGRELHDNDIVVVKGSGGYESAAKPMEVGVFLGKSVRTINGTRSARDMFLVENPSSMEEDLRKAILEKIAKEKLATAQKQAKKKTQPANVVGMIYKMTKDKEVFLYCGKKKVSVYKNGQLIAQSSGHFYLSGARFVRNDTHVSGFTFDTFVKENENSLSQWGGYHDMKTQTSVKNYETIYHQVSIPDTFEMRGTPNWKTGHGSYQNVQWVEHNEDYYVVVEPV